MTREKGLRGFKEVYKVWFEALKGYSEEEITENGTVDDWSIGQVYLHLINSTLQFHGKQIEVCVESKNNAAKRKNFKGFMVYTILGKFPPVKIRVPASDEYTPVAPVSKKEVEEGLIKVLEMMEVWSELLASDLGGKTPHPGFGYLSAKEWFRLIPMHWAHHLRQKKEIDQQ